MFNSNNVNLSAQFKSPMTAPPPLIAIPASAQPGPSSSVVTNDDLLRAIAGLTEKVEEATSKMNLILTSQRVTAGTLKGHGTALSKLVKRTNKMQQKMGIGAPKTSVRIPISLLDMGRLEAQVDAGQEQVLKDLVN